MSIRYWLHRWRGREAFVFRQGPVPGTARYKPSRRGYYRRFHTYPEMRDNEFVAFDPDCIEHRVRVRPERTRGNWGCGLPDPLDDHKVGRRGDSWKHYRRHQHRGR